MHDDPYVQIASRYDLFHGKFGEYDPREVVFYRKLFAEHNVRRLLDCACGTGTHLPLFHSLGCEVVGSDLSTAMLAQARANLASLGLDVPLRQVDYSALPDHFSERFDCVTCLSSSILHMSDEEQMLKALGSIRDVLVDRGILVLTQGTTDRQWREKPRFILASDAEDMTRLFVIDYHGQGARYNILDVEHGQDRGRLQTHCVDYARVWLRDDYARLLPAAGLRSVAFYGDYGFEPYSKESSRRLIAVAEKIASTA